MQWVGFSKLKIDWVKWLITDKYFLIVIKKKTLETS